MLPAQTIKDWKLGKSGKLDGGRTKVVSLIEAQANIPAHWRTALIAAIAEKPANHNWITIDCHNTSTTDIESSQENI
jgi:hypothetical protein